MVGNQTKVPQSNLNRMPKNDPKRPKATNIVLPDLC